MEAENLRNKCLHKNLQSWYKFCNEQKCKKIACKFCNVLHLPLKNPCIHSYENRATS